MKKTMCLLVLVLVASSGCNEDFSTKKQKVPRVAGVYDVFLASEPGPDKSFTVTVEKGGGSGSAMVSIVGPMVSDTATVVSGESVAVGDCGVWLQFGRTPEPGFYLAPGDYWTFTVSLGMPRPPVPGDTVDSTISLVKTGGLDRCGRQLCSGSMLGAALPLADPGIGLSLPSAGGRLLSVRIRQSGPSLSGDIPEQHALALGLWVSPGDTIELTYRRRLSADGVNGDFFRVSATSGPRNLDAEFREGSSMLSGDTTVSLQFSAASEILVITFAAGLSAPGESAVVDEVVVSSASAGVLVNEDFESGPGSDCGPASPPWAVSSPGWAAGSLCVSSREAISGLYSLRWEGGSYHQLSGNIISASDLSGLSSLLGGGLGSLFGGVELTALSGLFFEAWEPTFTRYFTTLALAQQGQGLLAGTFKGESEEGACVERGLVVAALHQEEETDLASGFWTVRIEGEAFDCNPALAGGNTLTFGDTLSTATGDTVRFIQAGGIFGAAEPLIDDYGNSYLAGGFIAGDLATVLFADPGGRANATGLANLRGDELDGSLSGTLLFDSARVCTLSGKATWRAFRTQQP